MKFKGAEKLLKQGEKVRRKMWGSRCFIYLDSDGKYKTQLGNEFIPNEMTKCGSDWESLGEYVDRLCRERDFLDDIIKDIAWRV